MKVPPVSLTACFNCVQLLSEMEDLVRKCECKLLVTSLLTASNTPEKRERGRWKFWNWLGSFEKKKARVGQAEGTGSILLVFLVRLFFIGSFWDGYLTKVICMQKLTEYLIPSPSLGFFRFECEDYNGFINEEIVRKWRNGTITINKHNRR